MDIRRGVLCASFLLAVAGAGGCAGLKKDKLDWSYRDGVRYCKFAYKLGRKGCRKRAGCKPGMKERECRRRVRDSTALGAFDPFFEP